MRKGKLITGQWRNIVDIIFTKWSKFLSPIIIDIEGMYMLWYNALRRVWHFPCGILLQSVEPQLNHEETSEKLKRIVQSQQPGLSKSVKIWRTVTNRSKLKRHRNYMQCEILDWVPEREIGSGGPSSEMHVHNAGSLASRTVPVSISWS